MYSSKEGVPGREEILHMLEGENEAASSSSYFSSRSFNYSVGPASFPVCFASTWKRRRRQTWCFFFFNLFIFFVVMEVGGLYEGSVA